VFHNGPRSSRGRAARLFVQAANNGELNAIVPLGQLFEQADDPGQAVMVYDVLERRTRDTSPWLNAYANERLDILNAARVVLPDNAPRPVLHVQQEIVVLDPPAADRAPVIPERPPTVVTSDTQNVHDSGTTQSLGVAYKAIKAATVPYQIPLSQCAVEIRNLCESANAAIRKKALQALDKIEKSTTGITCLNNEKEVDVLAAVWNRIHSAGYDDTVKDSLVRQLADCVDEQGYTTCTVGRCARLLDTLNIIDPLVTIKPRWAVRREINDLASKLQQEYGDDEMGFKESVRDECKRRYVDSGLMPQAMLNAELAWLETM